MGQNARFGALIDYLVIYFLDVLNSGKKQIQ